MEKHLKTFCLEKFVKAFTSYFTPYLWKVTPPSSSFINCFPSHLLSLFNLKLPCSHTLSLPPHIQIMAQDLTKRKATPSLLRLSKSRELLQYSLSGGLILCVKVPLPQLTQAKEGIKMAGEKYSHLCAGDCFFLVYVKTQIAHAHPF